MKYAAPYSGGGLAAGFAGLMQGDRMGQQSTQSADNHEMKQKLFDRQTQKFEAGEFNDKLYNIELAQGNGGDITEAMMNLNKWKQGSENFNDGSFFSKDNLNRHKGEDGKFNQQFLNQYKGDTGQDFVPGSTDAGEYANKIKNSLMYNKDGKSTIFDFDTFANGSGTYQTHRKEKKMQERLQEAKIAKALGGQGSGPSDIENYARLKEVGEDRTSVENTMYQALQKKLKMSEDVNIDKITSDFGNSLKSAKGGEAVNPDLVNQAVATQAKAKQKYSKRPERATEVAGSKRMVETYKDLGNLISKYDTGDGWQKGVQTQLLKKVGAEDFAKMEEEEQVTVTANAIKQTKIFSKVFQIIKEQSGAAFTDDEFARRLSTIVGGDPSKINEQSLMTAFGTYTAESLKDTKANLEGVSNLYMGDKLELFNEFNSGTQGFEAPTPESFASKGGRVTADEAVADVAQSEAEEATKTGMNVATGIKDALVGAVKGDGQVKPGKEAFKFSVDSRGNERAATLKTAFKDLQDVDKPTLKKWADRYYKSLSDEEKTEFKKQFVR